ncbi:MAG TPA: TolC family protein [Ramlibacter sp.]|jgi:outer membrane protein TolC|uniref:TolC family protein n=1 Tax=Ramlibacter sp. TaxID=1917967 RepID=UPI002D3496DC|nr:TolC family protein [Ramlibacter sp.]HZY18582.1 TolC family protein [Ramlibacter sp.]
MRNRTWYSLLPLVAALVLAGCGTVKVEPMTSAEQKARATSDYAKMHEEQEPITGPLTFEEVAARALKYNLDYRLKLAEQALSADMLDVSQYDMLPKLLVGAGWVSRSNESGGTSVGIESGVQTLSPSTSTERNRSLRSAELSWSILDFGISYYRAQQRADGVLMADERRRKVIQNVMQDVRNSYWRALAAQRMLPRVDALLERSRTALARSRQIEDQRLMPPPTVLAYQRALIDAVSLLQQRRQDLELARAELVALMNLAPGTSFTLADTVAEPLPGVPSNVEELEKLALELRPEVREEAYRKRVTLNDLRVAQLSIFPNLSASIGYQYDSNKYLYNNSWVDSGLHLSWNLLKLPQWPALKRAIGNQASVDDLRRYAQGMAVLTQVRVGAQRYALARTEFEMADQSARVDERLLTYTRAAVKTSVDGELELIRTEARSLLSEYQRHAAYSQAQAAWGRVYNSVGLDVLPQALQNATVPSLAKAIRDTMGEWQRVTFRTASPHASIVPDLQVVAMGAEADEVGAAASSALRRHGLSTRDAGAGWRLEVAWTAPAPGTGAARVNLRLVDPQGQSVRESASEFPVGERSLAVVRATVQSALDSEIAQLQAALQPAGAATIH